ncbi:Gfo/Idh/MocA family oxidoreductase [Alkalibacillus silvisoli]|uniref:Gfo/Idh/MocA family oxidoreductase n=1 Tax=Alkalibacillus silvisoli TaxID=392823 RepID=A0ABN1A5S4_9BACI
MLNVAIVGLGFIGKAHLDAYQKVKGAQVHTICTRGSTGQGKMENQLNYDIVSDFNSVLNNPEVDIVDLCIPTYLHEEYILKAAKAEKHIICEKPLTLTEESAERIIQVIEESKVRLFVGHVLRFWPEYQALKGYIDQGKLENVDWFHAQRLGQSPSWSDWFKDPNKSGGALFDLHIHDVDFAYSLFGSVESVYSAGQQNDQKAWSQVLTTLYFKNGVKATIEASHKMPIGYPFTMSYRAQSPSKTLSYMMKAGENINDTETSKHTFEFFNGLGKESVATSKQDPFELELQYFVDCLNNKQSNDVIPNSEVREVIRIMNAIQDSLERNQVIKL